MKRQGVNWYIKRFRAMSFPEVIYRVKNMLVNRKAAMEIGKLHYGFTFTGSNRVFEPEKIDFPADLSTLRLFEIVIPLESAYNWHYDPYSKNEFPKIFSRKIDTRGFNGMSAKHVWELNRMQFLPGLALKYHSTHDEKYLDQIVRLMKSWIDDNPYMTGINWYSNIELGLRLINWAVTWDLVDMPKLLEKKSELKHFVYDQWIPVIYAHCNRIRESLSLYSSANNHLLAELAGLFIASCYWNFDRSASWKKFSQRMLESEILRQNSHNGINKEETSGYIQYITDLFLLAYFYGTRTGSRFSDNYTSRLSKMFEYLYQLIDSNGNLIRYGDADDGHALYFGNDDHVYNFRSLLSTGYILFGNEEYLKKCAGYDYRNQLFFGNKFSGSFLSSEMKNDIKASSMFYPEEGHFFFRKSVGPAETVMHFDVAQLGYLSIAAHGHADALSYLLHVDGQPILVDCGTYTIHTPQDFRRYFKGTLAHNTVRVDERDQASYGGPSLWNDHFRTQVHDCQAGGNSEWVEGSHDGYARNGVLHNRKVVFNREEDVFQLIDKLQITDQKEHILEWCHHLAPDVSVEKEDDATFLLKKKGARDIRIRFEPALQVSIRKLQKDPLLGFYSKGFHEMEETQVLYCKMNTHTTTIVRTEISILS